MKEDIRSKIVADFVAKLEKGVAPWVRPWTGSSIPVNHLTGKEYRGANILVLWMAALDRGYGSNRWLTFRQATEVAVREARARGVKAEKKTNPRTHSTYYVDAKTGELIPSVRKGEKGTSIVFWKFEDKIVRDEKGEESRRRFAYARGYTVFNIEQCEISKPKSDITVQASTHERNPSAEITITNTKADIRFGGGMAYFQPKGDFIGMPEFEDFKNAESFYGTMFHELGHWSGHDTRLNRTFGKRFGDKDYAKEELVAELSSAFLCASHGIGSSLQHPEYLGHWVKALGENPSVLFSVASQAQKAADFVMGKKVEGSATEDEENENNEVQAEAA